MSIPQNVHTDTKIKKNTGQPDAHLLPAPRQPSLPPQTPETPPRIPVQILLRRPRR
ncbi:hypothetical protein EVJ58_g2348 [Rhodofomes roseus]|uniref:Uncharacterized protein n=1 Tax=Rhodofomes roseus TaxID=34475 RepID=A0A4Y9YR01_9APHY|nr:hypothetical protein EVJ58_g2348 [Rhodofomes roseus]